MKRLVFAAVAGLAFAHKEGRQAAWRANAMGVTAFVLKRRLGPGYHHPMELGYAQTTVRLVRSRTASSGVAADPIGMMGFSAGGHLAATAAAHCDDGNQGAPDPVDLVSSRPDSVMLAYPVISFDPAIARAGSVRSLLGDPSLELRREFAGGTARRAGDSTRVPVPYQRQCERSRGKQHSILPGVRSGQGSGGDASFESAPREVGPDFGDPAPGA